MEQREPTCLHDWPSRDRGRRSHMQPTFERSSKVRDKFETTKQMAINRPADLEHGEDVNDPARSFLGLPDWNGRKVVIK